MTVLVHALGDLRPGANPLGGVVSLAHAEGGERVTQYSDYPTSAGNGTPGVRDQITVRYRDGSTKSVTGATVVGTYYDYGASAGESWTLAASGSSVSSPRYEKTYYDMLHRVARVDKPGWASAGSTTLTTTNHYDAATGLLMRIENPGKADTLYAYDALARVLYACLDVDDDGTIDLGETDRISSSVTAFESADSAWWEVTRSYVYAADGSSAATEASSQWTRLTGFSGGVVAESIDVDALGNPTTTTRSVDRAHALVLESTVYPDAGAGHPEQRAMRGGRLERSITRSDVPTTYAYDALGHQTHVTDGRGNVSERHYDASFRVDWVEDGADKRTTYVYYGATAAWPTSRRWEHSCSVDRRRRHRRPALRPWQRRPRELRLLRRRPGQHRSDRGSRRRKRQRLHGGQIRVRRVRQPQRHRQHLRAALRLQHEVLRP